MWIGIITFEVLSAVAILGFVLWIIKYSKTKQVERFEPHAAKRSGRVERGSAFENPRLVLPVERAEMSIKTSPGSNNSPAITRATVPLNPVITLSAAIRPQGFGSRIAAFFGMQDIKTHNAVFDEQYVVRSSNEAAMRDLLNSDLQETLINLRSKSPTIEIRNGTISYYVHRYAKDAELIEEFIGDTEAVFSCLAHFLSERQSTSFGSGEEQPAA